jgi:hypothetical protein
MAAVISGTSAGTSSGRAGRIVGVMAISMPSGS